MTDQPAMPLDNKEAIAAINRSINFLISEFIQPTAQQTVLNSQLIESNARAIEATNAGINELRKSLEITSKVADDAAGESSGLERIMEEFLTESRAERQRSDERFNAQGQRIDRALDELAAQREAMRSLLSALATTNGRVDSLEQAS